MWSAFYVSGSRNGRRCEGGFDLAVARGRLLSRLPGNPGPAVDYPGQPGNHYPAAAACGNKTSWTNVGWTGRRKYHLLDIVDSAPSQSELELEISSQIGCFRNTIWQNSVWTSTFLLGSSLIGLWSICQVRWAAGFVASTTGISWHVQLEKLWHQKFLKYSQFYI